MTDQGDEMIQSTTRKRQLPKPILTKVVVEEKAKVLQALGLRISPVLEGRLSEVFELNRDGREAKGCNECMECGSKNKTNGAYCYECMHPMKYLQEILPDTTTPLPIDLTVIRHPKEKRTKSSALHAEVLAPRNQVRMFEMPLSDDITFDKETTCVIFPGESSCLVKDLPNLSKLKHVIVLDSSWHRSKSVNSLEQIQGIPRVHLQEYTTIFWRYQDLPDSYLATIEAIYYFYKEYATAVSPTKTYDGRYDYLMSIYVAQFRRILKEKLNSNSENYTNTTRKSWRPWPTDEERSKQSTNKEA